MNELDMSKPGYELFPEQAQVAAPYSSQPDVNLGHAVGDPLNSGVISNPDVADQGQVSDKEFNFRALRDEAAKFKEEREYWKGQAEAYARQQTRQPEVVQAEAQAAIDWDDSSAVKGAWEQLRTENQRLREEMRDSLAAVQTKAQHSDWNNMVTQHVPELTNKNPIFAEMIKNASNPYEAAYLLAELNAKASHSQQQAPAQQQWSNNAQRAMQNAQKPQTLASVGGQGQLSAADYYANMTDEDFMKIASRNLANI